MKTILVTGGAGFIGSNFIHMLLAKHDQIHVVNLDKLTYAGNLENLQDVDADPRYRFVHGDICDREQVSALFQDHDVDTVVHFAAESHVDRSILSAGVFVTTNVLGTQVLLDAAKTHGVDRFIHVSTDEVYGSLGMTGKFTETTPLHPNSPYAASKAASDLLALAYHRTFSLPVVITRCSNNYGPCQFPEKFVPLMIINALQDKPLPVYGDGLNVRDWIHVEDHCEAIDVVMRRGRIGEVYNIGGGNEWRNIDIVRMILKELHKPESLITHVKDRPGHDRRYALDASKILNDLSWKPLRGFQQGIHATIEWYLQSRPWWSRVLSGEYQEYYQRQYQNR